MKRLFVLTILFFTLVLPAMSQGATDWFSPEMDAEVTPFPIDPAIHHGKLTNGLTYYVLNNQNHQQTADIFLVMRSGSILEEDNQCGFANLIEHMARYGTKTFPGNSLQLFFEQNGIGGDNFFSYATFDESAFQFYDVPLRADNQTLLDSCLMVLRDWSAFMTFEEEAMNKARKVIDEERYTTKRPVHRMFEDEVLPKLMPETHYSRRHPIGDKKIVDNCTSQQLQKFYDKWFRRPDLQAVIVVGNVDPYRTENVIKRLWADVPAPEKPAPRVYEQINENVVPLVAVAADKEYDQNMIRFGTKIRKISPKQRNSQIGFIRALIRDVQYHAFDQRISKVLTDKNSPLVSVTAEIDDYLVSKSKRTSNFTIIYKDNRWEDALRYVMGLVGDIYSNGFTDEEITNAKAIIRKAIDKNYEEKNSLTNRQWADKMRNNFLESMPLLDPELEYHLSVQPLDLVPNEAYDEIFRQLVDRKRSQYIFCIGQDKPGVKLPTEKELVKKFVEFLGR